jgi:hypothetical protein
VLRVERRSHDVGFVGVERAKLSDLAASQNEDAAAGRISNLVGDYLRKPG